MSRLVIWDFDGTLARPSRWSQHLADALKERFPDHDSTVDDIRPHLSTGFPWHEPERLHPELGTPDEWWRRVEAVLSRAVEALGVARSDARIVARAARERYVRPANFSLFDDSMPVLKELRNAGWHQVILTNHVPGAVDLGVRLSGLKRRAPCIRRWKRVAARPVSLRP